MRFLQNLKRKLLARLSRSQAGFTMIELLIVITILGILAVAVLAAINPIEQINRSRDTASRGDAEQLLSAINRYYAFNGFYPWQTGAADTGNADLAWSEFDSTLTDSSTDCTVAEKLSTVAGVDCNAASSGELQNTFITRITAATYNPLFVFNNGSAGDSTYVCFAPVSNAFVNEVNLRLDPEQDGTLTNYPSDYPNASTEAIGNTTDCGTAGNCSCLP